MSGDRTKALTKRPKEADAASNRIHRVTSRNVEYDPSQVVGDREPCWRCDTRADVGCVHRAGL